MPFPPVKVLLVDDDEDDFIITRELIARIRDRRYQLEWVNNYDDAWATLQRRAHDICLLDYRLGERTGLELLRESQKLSGQIPMILLTGQGDHEIDMEAMQAGAADYLVKSQLDADKLERAIRYSIAGKRAEENLRRDRDLISRIMATSPVGIVVADQAGRITFANQRAEEVLDLTRDSVENGRASVLEWQLTDREGNPQPDQRLPLKQVLESGHTVQDARHVIQRSSRRVVLSANASPLFDAAGKIDGMVVTVEDITERLALEGRVRQSQKMESIGQLAAGVAHDINNVLTVIQGHTGLLQLTAPNGTDTAKSLGQINAASDRAASFIRQLLTFSRKQVFQTRTLELNGLLRSMEVMLRPMLGEDIEFKTSYGESVPHIDADLGMIEQIVMNLVVNARDAMPKGGHLMLQTSVHDIGADYVRSHPEARPGFFNRITVSDTGCGMERWLLQRIFEPFFTTKAAGRGTGLGLATVYGIVRQHHGWIEVESEVNVGTTFKVFLPVSLAKMQAPAVAEPVKKSETLQGAYETILLVEDEQGLLELAKTILSNYQYRVHTAASGIEAVTVWEQLNGKIDLLLTDMIMPGGMTGGELATELRKRQPDLKVIYSSGYSAELLGKDFGHSNAAFLAKPYLPAQLAKAVRESLGTVTTKAQLQSELAHPQTTTAATSGHVTASVKALGEREIKTS